MENQNRVAKVLLLLAGLSLVLCACLAIGGAVVYGVTRIVDVRTHAQVESFGFRFGDLPEEPSIRADSPGARIVEVIPGTPAERAGLQVDDLILAVDRNRLGPENDLADLIALYEPRDRVTLTVQSPGQDARRVRVVLGENPDRPGAPYLGVTYSSAQPSLIPRGEALPFGPGEGLDLRDMPFAPPGRRAMQGLVVVEVAEDGPAAAAGLRQGDAITTIDGEPLNNPRALVEALGDRQPGDRVMLGVYRSGGGNERELKVTLGEHPDQEGKAYLGVTIGGGFRFFRTPGGEGGALPPGFESGPGPFRFGMPLDHLPFDLDELPGEWREFHREFEFHELPGADDDSL